jgi:hypothetical protein
MQEEHRRSIAADRRVDRDVPVRRSDRDVEGAEVVKHWTTVAVLGPHRQPEVARTPPMDNGTAIWPTMGAAVRQPDRRWRTYRPHGTEIEIRPPLRV